LKKRGNFFLSFRIQSFFFLSSGTHKIVGPGRLFEHKPHRRINEAITTRNGGRFWHSKDWGFNMLFVQSFLEESAGHGKLASHAFATAFL
jgi:hypothetical protein